MCDKEIERRILLPLVGFYSTSLPVIYMIAYTCSLNDALPFSHVKRDYAVSVHPGHCRMLITWSHDRYLNGANSYIIDSCKQGTDRVETRQERKVAACCLINGINTAWL